MMSKNQQHPYYVGVVYIHSVILGIKSMGKAGICLENCTSVLIFSDAWEAQAEHLAGRV